MLVLTRKVGEKILLGDDVVVSVVEVNRGSVRLGVEAPQSISILRFEVYERIQEENLDASRAAADADIQQMAALWRQKEAPGEKKGQTNEN
jgi:carbon storage regulator